MRDFTLIPKDKTHENNPIYNGLLKIEDVHVSMVKGMIFVEARDDKAHSSVQKFLNDNNELFVYASNTNNDVHPGVKYQDDFKFIRQILSNDENISSIEYASMAGFEGMLYIYNKDETYIKVPDSKLDDLIEKCKVAKDLQDKFSTNDTSFLNIEYIKKHILQL
jgi:hypothetical protein